MGCKTNKPTTLVKMENNDLSKDTYRDNRNTHQRQISQLLVDNN